MSHVHTYLHVQTYGAHKNEIQKGLKAHSTAARNGDAAVQVGLTKPQPRAPDTTKPLGREGSTRVSFFSACRTMFPVSL